MFACKGVYNFNIKEPTSSSGLTYSLPNVSIDFLDKVQLSSSHDETIICSSLPKFIRCVKCLLSFSGSENPILETNASNIDFLIILSSI